ncbi:hypothetical protein BDF22DRAFT_745407 [Syncephalis plumigaleata]|nr:hypothetical protein BDF22DRAFT_745407 [Syncephalis plumigaleata]
MKFTVAIAIAVISVKRSSTYWVNIQPPVGASNVAPPVGMSNAPPDQLITLLNHYKRAILSGNHQDKTPYLKDIDAVMIKIRGNKIPKEALESITNVIQSMNQDNISRVLSSFANRA